MRTKQVLIASLIASIAILAIVVPLAFLPQDSKAQTTTTGNAMADGNSMTSPHHDMTKMYTKTKSQVHLGMIFFIGMLFLDNAINVYTYFFMFDLYQAALIPFVLAVRIVQLVGSLVFLKITWQ